MTHPPRLILIYAAWLVACGIAGWFLARWSSRRRIHGVFFALLVLIALVNIAQLVYVFGFGESIIARPRNALERFLQHTDTIWYLLFALWPLAGAVGIAQASLKILPREALARWLAFAGTVVIAMATPLNLFFTTCGIAGACL